MKKIICVFATSPGQLSHVDSGGEALGCGVCLHFTERMFDLMGNHLCQECTDDRYRNGYDRPPCQSMLTDAVFKCPGSHPNLKSVGCASKLSFKEFIARDCCEAAKISRGLVKYKNLKMEQSHFDRAVKAEQDLEEQLKKEESSDTRVKFEKAVTARKIAIYLADPFKNERLDQLINFF